jgi:hypothetical protein
MPRELAPLRDGLRVMVLFTLKRLRPEDMAKLYEHMKAMKADWQGEFEITQRPEDQLPEGA